MHKKAPTNQIWRSVYLMEAKFTTPERKPYMLTKSIEAIKTAVRIEQVAAEYGTFKLAGPNRLLGRCIAPAHTDKTPSMTVFTDSGRFKCFGCQLGGDLVDLEEAAGQHIETWTAVVALAERYGVELPRRSERWHGWQSEKDRRREAILDVLTRGYQRRYLRVFGGYVLEGIEDPAEREAEARQLYADLYPVARAAATNRLAR